MGVSSGKHKEVKQFYKIKKDRRLACNPESRERKKRLANNIDERAGLSASTVRPCLDSKNFHPKISHRILRHMHGALNIDEKN